jgi:hypothetical protein
MSYYLPVSREEVFPETPGIALLQSIPGHFRIAGLDGVLFPNTPSVYGLQDIAGHDALAPDRYRQFLKRIDSQARFGPRGTIVALYSETAILNSPLLDLLNVRYILVSPTESLEEKPGTEGLRQVYGGDDMRIYERLSLLPRANAVCRFQVVGDSETVLDGLADGSFDPSGTVWLQVPPDMPNTTMTSGCVAASPEITRYTANEIVVEVEMASPGFLVMSEIAFPGWRAFVDDEETQVYTGNYMFRAVYLPAGAYEVRFAYVPTGFWVGVGVGLIVLIGIAGVLGRAAWRRLARRRNVGRDRL